MMWSWLFSPPLPPGTPAPDFTLPDDAGKLVTLSELRGKAVALVFYPGDDTPGCTRQLCELRDAWEALRARGVEVFGINPASARRHRRFREKYRFPFPLLADVGQRTTALYRANGPWVKRTVYLVGADGVIRFARRGAPAADEILACAG
ncbi:MAG: peroxiredoxin [Bryobacteraceae bacterium]|jgi:peroxiredoxin Q/BCP